jgi:hypothetical protein
MTDDTHTPTTDLLTLTALGGIQMERTELTQSIMDLSLQVEAHMDKNASSPEDEEIAILNLIMALKARIDTAQPDRSNTPPCPIETLKHHADILDHAYRRLIRDADQVSSVSNTTWCSTEKYAAAFKAQDQYRRTVKTLAMLQGNKARKRREKTTKTRGKRP